MGKVAIYKQAKDINNLEEKHYLTRYQKERFMENNCNKVEKKATLKLGSINIQEINLFACYGGKGMSLKTADCMYKI